LICRSAGGTPTNEHHVLVCIGVVDVDVDRSRPESSIRRRHVASGKTTKRWLSCFDAQRLSLAHVCLL
jgi:hypothetical protein